MPIPMKGERFPDFKLAGFDSAQARVKGPLLVIAWKIGCPVSRMTLPFFDRIQGAYPAARVLGVAQENEQELSEYVRKNGIAFQQLPDADLSVSKVLNLDLVPSYWLIDTSGMVLEGGQAWNRELIESINERLASLVGIDQTLIILPSDNVPVFTPG